MISTLVLYILFPITVTIYIIRQYIYRQFGSLDPQDEESVRGKIILVTGANTGIGREVALGLAERGGHVIMACRNLDACKKAIVYIRNHTFNGQLIPMKLDLSSLASVREFAQEFRDKYDKIDILVNNAGVFTNKKTLTKDNYELHMQTNHLGHFLMTNLLLDLIKNSENGRVVIVSSIALKLGQRSLDLDDLMSSKSTIETYDMNETNPLYANSKLANALFAKELTKRLENTGIRVYTLCPGLVNTDISRNIMTDLSKIYFYIMNVFMAFLGKNSKKGAETVLFCALSKKISHETGQLYRHCDRWTNENAKFPEDYIIIKETLLPLNENDAVKLWKLSEKLVGL